MRHAFLTSEIRFKKIPKGFSFKSSNISENHKELKHWPSNMTAKEAKIILKDKGITPSLISRDGYELPLEGGLSS